MKVNYHGENFFANFTNSFVAARVLLKSANKEGSLIEGLILYAALVDAFLRNLLAVDGKGSKETIELNKDLFIHNEKNSYSERKIYKLAYEAQIINEDEFLELGGLYTFRNRIVHRFIISEVSYAELAPTLERYELIYKRLYQKLSDKEKPGTLPEEERRNTEKAVLSKIKGHIKD